MRRLWAASAAIVVCLTLGGMPALAQQASESPAAPSAGPVTLEVQAGPCAMTEQFTSQTYEGEVEHLSGATLTCQMKTDDPRVAGPWAVHPVCDCTDLGCACWGAQETVGPDGGWVGYYVSVEPTIHPRANISVAEGTGAYEGWTFIATIDQTGKGTGMLYEGPPPAWPPLPSTASD